MSKEDAQSFRVESTIKGSLRIPHFLGQVYKFADNNNGFYTNRDTSIVYNDSDLVLNIAFQDMREARQFIRDLKSQSTSFQTFSVDARIVEDTVRCGADSVIYADDHRKIS